MISLSPGEMLEKYNRLPYPVREYLAGTKLGESIERIGRANGLHIDSVGGLAKIATYMLMGVIDPSELMGEMRALGIEDAKVTQIVRELNEQVFKPLHQKMREGAQQQARVPAPPQIAVPAPLGRTEPSVPSAPPPPTPQIPVVSVPEPEIKPDGPAATDALPVYEPLPRRETRRPYIAPDISGLPTPPPPKSYARDPYREPIE